MSEPPRSFLPPPTPPPPPPPPKPWSLPPELEDDDDPFKEKRFQKELQFRLVGAIERSDNTLLESLVKSGVNTNARILLVKTPLTHAADQDEVSTDIISTLLNGGADVNLADFTPRNLAPLHILASKGNIKAAEVLINQSKSREQSCDLEIRDKAGCTPLHFASQFGKLDMVRYLVEQTADIAAIDYSGCSALHRACENLHYDCVEYLLDSGHDVNIQDNFNWSPLFYSVFFTHTKMVELLLRYGADVMLLDTHKNSVLSAVCYCQHSVVDFYPIQRIVSTSFDYYERTWSIPPHALKDHLISEDVYFLWDSDSRRLELLKTLINCGADPNRYPSDEMALMDYGEFAKRRMYLILAGAKLSTDDVWVKTDDDSEEAALKGSYPEWLTWFQTQLVEQRSLKRQCRNSIRKSLAWTRDINSAINGLSIPSAFKAFLRLDEFESLMVSFERFRESEEPTL